MNNLNCQWYLLGIHAPYAPAGHRMYVPALSSVWLKQKYTAFEVVFWSIKLKNRRKNGIFPLGNGVNKAFTYPLACMAYVELGRRVVREPT